MRVRVKFDMRTSSWRQENWLAQTVESERGFIVALAGLVSMAYSSVLWSTYGYFDDYILLGWAKSNNTSILRFTATYGRPVSGLIQELLLSLTTSVGGLRWVRLVGMLGTVLFSVAIYLSMRRFEASKWWSLLAAILSATSPALAIYTAWAITAPAPWFLAVAVASYFGVEVARTRRASGATWRAHLVWPVVGMSLVALGSQATTLAYLLPIAISVLFENPSLAELWRRGRFHLLALAPVALMAAIVFRLGTTLATEANDRTSFVRDPGEKAVWFVRGALARSFDQVHLMSRPRTSVAIAACIAFGLLVGPAREFWRRITSIGLAILCLPLGYLPNLITAENWSSARTLPVVMTLVSLMTVRAFQNVKRHWMLLTVPIVSVALLLGALQWYRAATNVYRDMVVPQELEYRALRVAIHKAVANNPARLVVYPASWSDGLSNEISFDEFGIPSLEHPNYVIGFVRLMQIRHEIEWSGELLVSTADRPIPILSEDAVVDVGAELRSLRDSLGRF